MPDKEECDYKILKREISWNLNKHYTYFSFQDCYISSLNISHPPDILTC